MEVLFDEHEAPFDYRFVEVNPAFTRATGLAAAPGKTMLELVPKHEKHWFEAYGHVARTGEAIRFENRAEALGRGFDVYAFRIGEPRERRVATLFKNL